MHRALAVGWSLPCGSTEVGDELIQSRQAMHARKLADIKPTMNTVPSKVVHTHLNVRRKKVLNEFQRTVEIEHQNMLLVQRLRTILSRKQVDNIPSITSLPRSLNRRQRTQVLTDIVKENSAILKRLASTQSVLQPRLEHMKMTRGGVIGTIRSEEENREIIKRHCVFPFHDPMEYRQQYYADPGNPYKNWSGGRVMVNVPQHRPQSSYSSSQSSSSYVSEEEKSVSSPHPPSHPHPHPPVRPSSSYSSSSRRPTSASAMVPSQPIKPTSLIAQDPILISSRRRGVHTTKFVPLKSGENHSIPNPHPHPHPPPPPPQANVVGSSASSSSSSSSATTPTKDVQTTLVRRPQRPQTAAPTNMHTRKANQQHHTSEVEAMMAQTLSSLIPIQPSSTPIAPSSTSIPVSSSSPTSASASASLTPSLPTMPLQPGPLLLFEGIVPIDDRMIVTRFIEKSQPWRIEIECVDTQQRRKRMGRSEEEEDIMEEEEEDDNGNIIKDRTKRSSTDHTPPLSSPPLSWSLSIDFSQLKPFFHAYPDLFSPTDRLKVGLVNLLKDGLTFLKTTPTSSSSDNVDDASTPPPLLVLDLIEPPPPVLQRSIHVPRPGSAKRRHEELKLAKQRAYEKSMREKYIPKTETILTPRGGGGGGGQKEDPMLMTPSMTTSTTTTNVPSSFSSHATTRSQTPTFSTTQTLPIVTNGLIVDSRHGTSSVHTSFPSTPTRSRTPIPATRGADGGGGEGGSETRFNFNEVSIVDDNKSSTSDATVGVSSTNDDDMNGGVTVDTTNVLFDIQPLTSITNLMVEGESSSSSSSNASSNRMMDDPIVDVSETTPDATDTTVVTIEDKIEVPIDQQSSSQPVVSSTFDEHESTTAIIRVLPRHRLALQFPSTITQTTTTTPPAAAPATTVEPTSNAPSITSDMGTHESGVNDAPDTIASEQPSQQHPGSKLSESPLVSSIDSSLTLVAPSSSSSDQPLSDGVVSSISIDGPSHALNNSESHHTSRRRTISIDLHTLPPFPIDLNEQEVNESIESAPIDIDSSYSHPPIMVPPPPLIDTRALSLDLTQLPQLPPSEANTPTTTTTINNDHSHNNDHADDGDVDGVNHDTNTSERDAANNTSVSHNDASGERIDHHRQSAPDATIDSPTTVVDSDLPLVSSVEFDPPLSIASLTVASAGSSSIVASIEPTHTTTIPTTIESDSVDQPDTLDSVSAIDANTIESSMRVDDESATTPVAAGAGADASTQPEVDDDESMPHAAAAAPPTESKSNTITIEPTTSAAQREDEPPADSVAVAEERGRDRKHSANMSNTCA